MNRKIAIVGRVQAHAGRPQHARTNTETAIPYFSILRGLIIRLAGCNV
ncbi:hypothetical protein [Paenibacillus turpanensis]|nr:hypothetical protein [Paenibacillus turpanensis]